MWYETFVAIHFWKEQNALSVSLSLNQMFIYNHYKLVLVQSDGLNWCVGSEIESVPSMRITEIVKLYWCPKISTDSAIWSENMYTVQYTSGRWNFLGSTDVSTSGAYIST